MFTYKFFCGYRAALVSAIFTRNKTNKTTHDPVQQLFLEKIREYRSKKPDGSLLDPSPAILKELKSEMAKLDKNYGGGKGVDMTAFPTFKFEEPKLDPIDEAPPEKEKKQKKMKKAVKKKAVAAKRGSSDWLVKKKDKKKK
ncbi:hypothetical protein PYW07_007273 [Mythimna separata]|uniref:ATP synthase-coupling factor 6, mitochondrial n=1 Tax=Mythimna separata TaxID=271217 RepID=A0AAD7Z1I7_MYTSE|nr:hypothetical protein PYW07_007273 [Mythimna separata]